MTNGQRGMMMGLGLLVGALTQDTLWASERRFAYSYESTGMPKGGLEYEQWVTWKSYDDKERFDFRHEFEYGLTDTLTLDVYLTDWRYENADGDGGSSSYEHSGISLRKMLTDPNQSTLGSGLYGEVLVGEHEVALEGKLLLQKNIGPVVLVYNLIIEAEWEGENLRDLDESVGVWENTAGLSYQVNPNLLFGLEAVHEVEFEEWRTSGEHVVYAGPNISLRAGRFFATAAALAQATDVDEEADTEMRVLAGVMF